MKEIMTILDMHGYGVYVYSSYAIVLSALGLHFFLAIKGSRKIHKQLLSLR